MSPEEIAYQMAHISDNKQPNIIASVAVLITFCYVAVGLRLWARRKVGARLMADDYWALVALVFSCHGRVRDRTKADSVEIAGRCIRLCSIKYSGRVLWAWTPSSPPQRSHELWESGAGNSVNLHLLHPS